VTDDVIDSPLLFACFSYQFYIHIKADIIDGKLLCSAEQAVLFAAYAAQGFAVFEYILISYYCNIMPCVNVDILS